MTRKAALWGVAGIVGCAALALILWRYFGAGFAPAGLAPLALAAARKRKAVAPEPPQVYEDDAQDAARAQDAQDARDDAGKAAGSGWAETPVRDRPRLRLLWFCLLPALAPQADAQPRPRSVQVDDAPTIKARCVDALDAVAPLPGLGLWVEGTGEAERVQWCPCLPAAAYGETTRLPQGCPAGVPVIAYRLQAHADTAADLAHASERIPGLEVDLKTARTERDRLHTKVQAQQGDLQALTGRESALLVQLAAQEQATKAAQDDAAQWFTWRSVLLTSAVAAIAGGAVYGICTAKKEGC